MSFYLLSDVFQTLFHILWVDFDDSLDNIWIILLSWLSSRRSLNVLVQSLREAQDDEWLKVYLEYKKKVGPKGQYKPLSTKRTTRYWELSLAPKFISFSIFNSLSFLGVFPSSRIASSLVWRSTSGWILLIKTGLKHCNFLMIKNEEASHLFIEARMRFDRRI